MGGNCAKQKRYKRPPSSESEDSEDSESSRSNTRGSKTSRKRSSKRSSRTTASNTRPRTPTKAITAIKQKVNIGNDQFYRKLNPKNPEFGKTPAGASHSSRSNCEKSTASSAYSKMYINAKDINTKEALLLMPKGGGGKHHEMNSPPGCAQYHMEYYHQESPYGQTTAKQLYFDQGHQVTQPKTAMTPQAQQYQYQYLDQKKEIPGGAHYYKHVEKAQFQGSPPMIYSPGIASPFNPQQTHPRFFFASSNYAWQIPPLPSLPPPPAGTPIPGSYGFQPMQPSKSSFKTDQSRPATAEQVASLNRNVQQLAKNMQQANGVTVEQLAKNFNNLKADFEATLREFRNSLQTSQIGKSGSMMGPEECVSRLQNCYKTIASNVNLISRNQQSLATQPGSQAQQGNTLSMANINETMEQFIRDLNQLKSQLQNDKDAARR